MKGFLRVTGGKKLKSPFGVIARPTTSRVREAVMNILRDKLQGCNWLDLFSGSGVMGCEALQKGAKIVISVERDRKTARICKENLISISKNISNKNQVEVIQDDVLKFLQKGTHQLNPSIFSSDITFDIVYVDPPYTNQNIYLKVLEELKKGSWVKKGSIVICEYSSKMNFNIDHPWVALDKRIYGISSLILLSLQK